jgi:hypothetical protein
LEKVSKSATFLCFCINSFSGQLLNEVASAKCRLFNSTSDHELCSFDLSNDSRLDCTALLMCVLYRAGPDGTDWYMHAVGEPAQGKTILDNVDEFQQFLSENCLVERQNEHIAQMKQRRHQKMAKFTVPAAMGGPNGRTIGFPSAGGSQQYVEIPLECKEGDEVELPLVDVC